jgi:hypothetical protein
MCRSHLAPRAPACHCAATNIGSRASDVRASSPVVVLDYDVSTTVLNKCRQAGYGRLLRRSAPRSYSCGIASTADAVPFSALSLLDILPRRDIMLGVGRSFRSSPEVAASGVSSRFPLPRPRASIPATPRPWDAWCLFPRFPVAHHLLAPQGGTDAPLQRHHATCLPAASPDSAHLLRVRTTCRDTRAANVYASPSYADSDGAGYSRATG